MGDLAGAVAGGARLDLWLCGDAGACAFCVDAAICNVANVGLSVLVHGGAQESYVNKLRHGSWQGFASSLGPIETMSAALVTQQMRLADEALAEVLGTLPPEQQLAKGQPAHEVVFQISNMSHIIMGS